MSSSHTLSGPEQASVFPAPGEASRSHKEVPDNQKQDLEKGLSPEQNAVEERGGEATQERDRPNHKGKNSTPVTNLASEALRSIGLNCPSRDISEDSSLSERPTILRVVDLNFDGSEDPEIQLEWNDRDINLRHALLRLPLQPPRTVRGFVCNFGFSDPKSPARDLKSYLAGLGLEDIKKPEESDVLDYVNLATQWQGNGSRVWLGTRWLAPAIEPNVCAYLQCITGENDSLIALYSYPDPGPDPDREEARLRGLRDAYSKRVLNGQSRTTVVLRSFLQTSLQRQTMTSKVIVKLLTLNFLHESLEFAVEMLEARVSIVREEERMYGYKSLDYGAIDDYINERSKYQSFVDEAQDIIDSIDFIISSITQNRQSRRINTRSEDPLDTNAIDPEEIFEIIRASSIQLRKLAASNNSYIERRYNLYLSTLNIHESEAVKRLTALATGFLPLSLGATLLSMQTRLADLKLLLYDFVGVGLILFFLMFGVFLLLKLIMKTTSWRPFGTDVKYEYMKLTPKERKILKTKAKAHRIFYALCACLPIGLGIYTMISFTVGMFDDVSLGLKIWGYGIAAFIGLILVMSLLILAAYFVLKSRVLTALLGSLAFLGRSKRRRSETSEEDYSSADSASLEEPRRRISGQRAGPGRLKISRNSAGELVLNRVNPSLD